jgi:lipopolysaccharide/colanic/teichoic acid biosynthesis glycosyltransferase
MATIHTVFRSPTKKTSATSRTAAGQQPSISRLVSQDSFRQSLRMEQRRTERSGRPFILMMISGEELHTNTAKQNRNDLIASISGRIRETDVLGWYEEPKTLGIIMTEFGEVRSEVIETIVNKISTVLQSCLGADAYCRVTLTIRIFPNESEDLIFNMPPPKHSAAYKIDSILKRAIDIIGSLIALICLSPLFLILAILIKSTSKGPVFYCKKRLGQYGRDFSFYKFRTMAVNNDPNIHREFVSKLIHGSTEAASNGGIYKIKNDPRVTPIGRWLRRSSLDELPQFLNVLLNDMSLVGPRPPLRYEYDNYSHWHKRRILEVKPGITGLWQVEARSLAAFDEMVRIDLRYAQSRTIWLDFKIMLRTPAAMLSGRGAC